MNLTDSRLAQAGNERLELAMLSFFEQFRKIYIGDQVQKSSKRTLVGLVRDLRGIAFAFNAKTSFMMLFDWMSQRLQFDVSSPNGILLFRETSKMITTYGNRILTLGEVPKEQVYGVKLKGVSVCFAMLKAVLSGNYVNFGVFRLYGDDALDNALQTFIKLLLSIPHSDLLDYPKLSQSFYSLLEVLTQDHMNFIASLEPHVVILDHIVTYLFKQLSRSTKKRPAPMATDDRFLHIMQQHPEMIQQVGPSAHTFSSLHTHTFTQLKPAVPVLIMQMLSTVLNIIIFEDCRNQWSMSRPLLGLILLNEKVASSACSYL
ncbi:hypothetical protein XENOCAPTIV_013642 [Xenoophorus captivus]|uniref:Exportin-7/Ran-binding protein 17 TPR repeats domain-containing protein n=1 Tax=Xenoophorus captivus TaxID=1517983 RepID=A0ABV0RDX0_9TELE